MKRARGKKWQGGRDRSSVETCGRDLLTNRSHRANQTRSDKPKPETSNPTDRDFSSLMSLSDSAGNRSSGAKVATFFATINSRPPAHVLMYPAAPLPDMLSTRPLAEFKNREPHPLHSPSKSLKSVQSKLDTSSDALRIAALQAERLKGKGIEGMTGNLHQPTTILLCSILSCVLLNGCAAISNPIADGVPVNHLPEELLGKRRPLDTIPLTLLGQEEPPAYHLAAGDTLGVWIDGIVIGNQPPPTHFVQPPQSRLAPSAGYPVAVTEDGTIELPLIDRVTVQGLTVAQAQDAIRKSYVDQKILQPGRDRILVTLMDPRKYKVTVFRQEGGGTPTTVQEGLVSNAKRGTGYRVDLQAYENDVLHALSQTGGLPGTDAFNEIIVEHRQRKARAVPSDSKHDKPEPCANVVRIPLRRHHGEPPPFAPEDVILDNGDVVFVEARDQEVFFTGGLLPPGTYLLPRDRDLTVLEAIPYVKGPLLNGGFATSNLAGTVINPGVGGPSPSLLIVLRRTPDGGQIPIRIDLDRALRDPRQQILVQQGDMLILQETPGQAVARYITQTLSFSFSYIGKLIHSPHNSGAATIGTSATLQQIVSP